jgi:excisionase family DNA binding protein
MTLFPALTSLTDNSIITRNRYFGDSTDEAVGTYTVEKTAAILNCSISFVYKLMDQGQLAFERRGRRKLPVQESVVEYRQRSLVPTQKPSDRSKPTKGKEPYKCKYL